MPTYVVVSPGTLFSDSDFEEAHMAFVRAVKDADDGDAVYMLAVYGEDRVERVGFYQFHMP